MKFRIKRRKTHQHQPQGDDYTLAVRFADKIKNELQDFVKAIVLFGSVSREERANHIPDIDILMVVDDLTMMLSEEVIEAYRIITENTASAVSRRLHITTMKLTNFWEYVRNGDPIAVNMLRDGYPLFDTGLFEPLQQLLHDGRIKPTRESMYSYFARAPLTMANADWHILQACTDLYWAVIDAAHAALMKYHVVPPTPGHVSEELRQNMSTMKLHKKYVRTMNEFFTLNKNIVHRKIQSISGKDYDTYKTKAQEFIREMQRIVKE
ncbi:hypothetical protein GF342_01485 [Candidatus Woesearchaeota archaeon]|nr:hypothetical protein [Candidatus Woesearchaeota archaeon]